MPDSGRQWRGLAAALVVPPLLTAVLTTLTERLNLSSQVLIYLVALVVISRMCGMVPALVAAVWAATAAGLLLHLAGPHLPHRGRQRRDRVPRRSSSSR